MRALADEMLQYRKGESGGFAGAGLGDADDISSVEGERHGLGLDRGGGYVVLLSERTSDRLGEAETLKRGQSETFQLAKGSRAGKMPPRISRVMMTSRVVWAAVDEQIKAETVRSRDRFFGFVHAAKRQRRIIRSCAYMAQASTFFKLKYAERTRKCAKYTQ